MIANLLLLRSYEFAKGCADDEKLSDIVATLDEQTLSRLIRDHEAGKLEQICRDYCRIRKQAEDRRT